MKKVAREDILDNASYERMREALRERVMVEKRPRRVHLGEHLTFLFETTETVRIQVQEMLRIEGRSSEEDVRHELDTYNELLGDEGELGCTLLVEIEDEAERARLLRAWRSLVDHLFVELEGGARVAAVYDPRQLGDDRLSSVQYLKFPVGGRAPVALVADLSEPRLALRTGLTPEQRAALAAGGGAGGRTS